MKILLLILGVLFASLMAYGAPAPFSEEEYARFLAVEARATVLENAVGSSGASGLSSAQAAAYAAQGHLQKKVLKVVWDPSQDSSVRSVAAHGLGYYLPGNALITKTYAQVDEQLVSASNNGTIAFVCVNGVRDLVLSTAADIDAYQAESFVIGDVTGNGSTGFIKNNSSTVACEINASVATNAFTAGRLNYFIEYVIAQ